MALPVVTHDLTTISLAEVDDWDSGVGTLDQDSQIQGTGCLSITESTAGLKAIRYETVTQVDMTGKMIIGWLTFARLAMLETAANGGLRLCAQDTSARNAEWYIGGANTLSSAGWTPYVVHCDRTPDVADSGFDKTLIVKIGYRVNLAIKGIIKWDAFRYGTSIGIKRGTSTPGEGADFADIWAAEDNVDNKFGILTKFEGIYFLQGKLTVGSTTAGEDTYFSDKGQIVVFKDVKVPSNFYTLTLQGNSTANTTVSFGTKIGTGETAVGNAGIVFRSANKATTPFQIDCLGSNINSYGFYACIFQDGGLTKFDKISTNTAELISCSWNNMNQVDVNDAFVRKCTFSGYTPDTIGALKWNGSIDIKGCAFNANTDATNNPAAIEHPAQGTFTYTDLTFSGNDYDINYTAAASSGVLTILKSGTSNPVTSKILNPTGNSVSIEASTTVNITIVDSAGATITANCEVTIVRVSDTEILFAEDNVTDGTTQYNFTTGGGTATYINVHNIEGFQNRLVFYTLPASGTENLSIQLDDERYYSNP